MWKNIKFAILVIILMPLVSFAQEKLIIEDIKASEIKERLNNEGLTGLFRFITQSKNKFPSIYSDEYYKLNKNEQEDRQLVILGSEILKSLPKYREVMRNTEDEDFYNNILLLIGATQKIIKGGGYRNLIIDIILEHTTIQLLIERIVLQEGDAKRLSKVYSPFAISPQEFLEVIKKEYSNIPDIKFEDNNIRINYLKIASAFIKSNIKSDEYVRGFITMKTDHGLFYNYNSIDVPPVIGAVLVIKYDADILEGLFEIKITKGKFVANEPEFINIAQKEIFKIKQNIFSPFSGEPYNARDFWKVYQRTKKDKEHRIVSFWDR